MDVRFAKTVKGKVYVVAQDGVILKDTYVKVSAHRKVVKLKKMEQE